MLSTIIFSSGSNQETTSGYHWKKDSLKFSQERHDYYDMLQEAAETGQVTEEQRYHLRKYYKEKREKMCLVEEITSNHYEGLGDSTEQEERLQELLDLDEQKADEKDKEKLLFKQKFFQFYFSASLVLTLLWFWLETTLYFMVRFYPKFEKESQVLTTSRSSTMCCSGLFPRW